MKTLENERLKHAGRVVRVQDEHFWNEYGSYRVVEGVLHCCAATGDMYVSGAIGACSFRTEIGKLGAHVKVLLPPEEKRGLGTKVAVDMMMKLVEVERDRADKYEKALREIEKHEAIASYMVLRDIAREALDDTE